MALKLVLLASAVGAVLVGFALPTPHSTAQAPAESQISTLELN
ncbi:MAG TPA: hypothetical protein PKB04_01785 [Phenylobacterium sp.]|jgi:hypothetical protein|nr:hypothetical protein [Phenylobacterium sp.]HMP63278.1 hypothetical protein [Phenylobacterium sp.]